MKKYNYMKEALLPHSGGKGVSGDLLSANSVAKIKPVPRIYKFNEHLLTHHCHKKNEKVFYELPLQL